MQSTFARRSRRDARAYVMFSVVNGTLRRTVVHAVDVENATMAVALMYCASAASVSCGVVATAMP